jgi:hypothetical protein
MPEVMSEPTASLQVTVTKSARNHFKADAAVLDLDMSEYAQLVLDFVHEAFDADDLPPKLQEAIKHHLKTRDKKKP